MTHTEALKLALEALETSARNWPSDSVIEAITAIKEALAQPQQEPVQKMVANMTVEKGRISFAAKILTDGTYDLYTSPPPVATQHERTWVGLTNEEIENCYGGEIYDFARAIEAKLKEKNT